MTATDVVMVAYRNESVIADAVHAAAQLGGRVVVVDHGSGTSAEKAAAAGAVTVVDESNPGFGAGQNRGMQLTTSDAVLLCNPDARIMPEKIREAVSLLALRADVAAVQGVILNQASLQPERSAGRELTAWHLIGRAVGARKLLGNRAVRRTAARVALLRDHVDRVPTGITEVESLAATAILVRRTAFVRVAGFDPEFFLYGEDLDLSRRLRGAGYRLVAVPDVWAVHESGGSAESSLQRELHWWAGTMQFAARWWRGGDWAIALGAATARWLRLCARHPSAMRPGFSNLVAGPLRRRISYRGVRQASRLEITERSR